MNSRKGVTLIELLVVVLILGVIAAIALPRLGNSADNAKESTCAQNLTIMNEALERYCLAEGDYPKDLNKMLKDKDYFPHGIPECPLEGTYKLDSKDKVIYCTHVNKNKNKNKNNNNNDGKSNNGKQNGKDKD